MHVEEIMTGTVFTCTPEDSLSEAARILWEHDCGCVPVVGKGSEVVGMLTDRDICMAAYIQGRPLVGLQVSDAMSRRVVSCRPVDTVASAENLMRWNKVRRLPVVDDDGRLVGILSLNDVALEAAKQRAKARKEVTEEEVGSTLSSVCEHREREREPALT